MSKISNNLGEGSIGKLLFQLATPAIIAQLVNVLYNIVDRIFIGRIANGEVAMAGIGVATPVVLIISAFSALIGGGGAPLAAIKMGEKDIDSAEKIMSNSFSLLIRIGIGLTILFMIIKEPVLWAFGASQSTIGYASEYLGMYLIGTICVQISLGMNSFINTQGFAKIGMMTVAIGAIINIILDPIFIFGFDMGVRGAALATITGQTISALWALKFIFGKKSILKIRKEYLKLDMNIVKKVTGLGLAPFIMQSTESLVLIALNTRLQMYGGDLAIGAMTIMSSISQIILMPTMGITQGAQPIMSYNYGAKRIDRVLKTFKLCITCTFMYTSLMFALIMIMPETFVKVFNGDPALLEITVWSMKIYFAGVFTMGIQVSCQQTFLSLGQAKTSLFLAMLRKIVILIPLIFILPNLFEDKLFAVLLAQPIADVVAISITAIVFIQYYRNNLSKQLKVEETQTKESLNLE